MKRPEAHFWVKNLQPNCLIIHGACTWVFAESVVSGFKVYHNATIGRYAKVKPRIGNDVTIYTGSVVTGNATIGNGVRMGANAVVNFDEPDHHSVAPPPSIMKPRQLV